MLDLNEKVVLITGASGTLGSATARVFANSNARLLLTDLDSEKLSQVEKSLSNQHHSTHRCNLNKDQEIAGLVQHALDRFGRIDTLLNIAGGFAMGPQVHELSNQDFEHMFAMNFMCAFNTCRAVIPIMLTQGSGRIVNISARAATEGKGKMAPYCISKAAVITLTQSLAAEHKDGNINSNCILPGTIDTPANRSDMPNADHASWVPPEDIANMMLFLSSEHAHSVNGAIIPVYGKS